MLQLKMLTNESGHSAYEVAINTTNANAKQIPNLMIPDFNMPKSKFYSTIQHQKLKININSLVQTFDTDSLVEVVNTFQQLCC